MSSHHHITKYDIEKAKESCVESNATFGEHDDCIRIAYEWLDAQSPIENPRSKIIPLKQIIERWAGCYVSQSDIEVAVYLHLHLRGNYPRYNFSDKMVEPNTKRLEYIQEAFTQNQYREKHDSSIYYSQE